MRLGRRKHKEEDILQLVECCCAGNAAVHAVISLAHSHYIFSLAPSPPLFHPLPPLPFHSPPLSLCLLLSCLSFLTVRTSAFNALLSSHSRRQPFSGQNTVTHINKCTLLLYACICVCVCVCATVY